MVRFLNYLSSSTIKPTKLGCCVNKISKWQEIKIDLFKKAVESCKIKLKKNRNAIRWLQM